MGSADGHVAGCDMSDRAGDRRHRRRSRSRAALSPPRACPLHGACPLLSCHRLSGSHVSPPPEPGRRAQPACRSCARIRREVAEALPPRAPLTPEAMQRCTRRRPAGRHQAGTRETPARTHRALRRQIRQRRRQVGIVESSEGSESDRLRADAELDAGRRYQHLCARKQGSGPARSILRGQRHLDHPAARAGPHRRLRRAHHDQRVRVVWQTVDHLSAGARPDQHSSGSGPDGLRADAAVDAGCQRDHLRAREHDQRSRPSVLRGKRHLDHARGRRGRDRPLQRADRSRRKRLVTGSCDLLSRERSARRG